MGFSSICCGNCHRIGKKPPPAARLPLKLLTNTRRRRIYPSFPRWEKELAALTLPSDVTATHVRFTRRCGDGCLRQCVCVWVCVCVCVKPCVTSAECGVNVRLDDLWLDVSQIEVNAAAHDDDSYQPPCFLLTEAPLSSASCVLWHRKTQRYFTHCAAVSLWLEKKPLPLKKKMHCGQ